jgi:HEPN domain-containing protein
MTKFEEHRLLALEKLRLAEVAIDEQLYNACIENCHFALELIMKAAIYKAGGMPPTSAKKGHDLLEISKVKIGGVKYLHKKIMSTRTVLQLWLKIYNRWDTSKRYQYLEIDPLEMDSIFDAYRGVFKWIENNYVD